MLDMGMDPFNFADSLLDGAGAAPGAAQLRLAVPTSRASEPPDEIEELLGDYMNAFGPEPPVTRAEVLAGWTRRHAVDGRLMFHKSLGCEQCDHSGLKGRHGIHERFRVRRW